MTPLRPACMALEQETVLLHDPVDPFMVRGLAAFGKSFPAQDRVHPAIAIGRQVSDDSFDLGDKRVSRGRRTPDPLVRALLHLLAKAGASDPNHLSHGLHREPPGGSDTDRNSPFFGPLATSRASLRISASKVFLPRRRCNSRIWFWSAR